MPLQRRLPKVGFFPFTRVEYVVVNVSALAEFPANAEVNAKSLREKGLVKKKGLIKVLGDGEVKVPLKVTAARFSGTAKDKIEKAGGTAILET